MIDVLFDINDFNNKMRQFNGQNKEYVDRFMILHDFMNEQTKYGFKQQSIYETMYELLV